MLDATATGSEINGNNTYAEIVYKRLRTLKKRLIKIEKYEGISDHDTLNPDQLLAVQKKPEVVALIKELEELAVQLGDKDAEEKRLAKKKAKTDQLELQKAVEMAVNDALAKNADNLATLSRFMVAVGSILPRIPVTVVSKVNKPLLMDLYRQLVSDGLGMHLSLQDVDQLIAHKLHLINGIIQDQQLCSQLHVLYDFVRDLSEVEQFDQSASPSVDVVTEQQVPLIAKKMGSISFMTESEIAVEEYQDPAIVEMGSSSSGLQDDYQQRPQFQRAGIIDLQKQQQEEQQQQDQQRQKPRRRSGYRGGMRGRGRGGGSSNQQYNNNSVNV